MATTAHGLADFSNALLQVVQPYIQDNIPNQTKLLQTFKKDVEYSQINNTFYAPIRSSRHGGIANLANDKAKLRTGSSSVARASISPKILTGTFDISDLVKKASMGDKRAVESDMKFQMRTLTADFSKSVNRQLWSDGVGVLAQVATSGSVGVGTIGLTNPDSSLDDGRGDFAGWYGSINGDLDPTKYLAIGQAIGIGTAAADVGTITSITSNGSTAGTVIVTGAPAVANADAIYLVDGDENAAGTLEINGVRSALSVGTADYAGIARTSQREWQPQYMGTASNAALNVADMDLIYKKAREYAQEGDKLAWFGNISTVTKYGQLLTALRQTVNKTELVSGWSGLEYQAGNGQVGVFEDYDAPDGEMILLNLDTWNICQVADMGFLDQNLLRRSDYITYQQVFTWYMNVLNVCPAANGRMLRRTR